MLVITKKMMDESGMEPAEFDGLASIPLQIEGVEIGLTVRQRHESVFKVSARTTEQHDASAFCRNFGGGGHIRAAGCEITGTLDEVKQKLVAALREVFGY
ncbi:MAG: DHHA1 domain-containing protein [Oscillospiraceae bacterium]